MVDGAVQLVRLVALGGLCTRDGQRVREGHDVRKLFTMLFLCVRNRNTSQNRKTLPL